VQVMQLNSEDEETTNFERRDSYQMRFNRKKAKENADYTIEA